jgi:hypothetical protein
MKNHQFHIAQILLFIAGLIILTYSVIRSGLFYQFNIDEVAHVQVTYLLFHGTIPYVSFFLTLVPLFQAFLGVLFTLLGYTLHSMMVVRGVMIFLFILRLTVGYLLVAKLFNRKTACFFLPLLLLDPFTVFTAMQIRPDNLMMTVYTIGLLVLVYGLERSSKFLILISGIIFGISMVVLLKILPSMAVIFAVLAIYFYKRRQITSIVILLTGFMLPWIAAFGYFALRGLLAPMTQGAFIDRNTINGTLLNPVPIIYFFKGFQYELFGFPGRPLTWVYVWILPIIGFAGMVISALKSINTGRYLHSSDLLGPVNSAAPQPPTRGTPAGGVPRLVPPNTWKYIGRLILIVSLAIQWFWVFTVKGFFLQYLLTISWLWALFGAVFLLEVTEFIKKFIALRINKTININWDVVWLIIFLIFAAVSIKANFNRAAIRGEQYWQTYRHNWEIVKPGEKTFPNLLFRPVSYPLALGTFIGDVPESILRRYGPLYKTLESQKVRYLILDSYLLMYIDPDSRDYINTHYQKMPGEGDIYIRK